MFGTEIVSKVLNRELTALPEIIAIGGRVVGTRILPPFVALPATCFYFPRTEYPDQGMGAGTHHEIVWVVVRLDCEGISTDPIRPAAKAQIALLGDFQIDDEEYDDEHYQLAFDRESEIPEDMMVTDGQAFYRRLGTMYRVEITRGG